MRGPIKSISEAFSMQPIQFTVGVIYDYEKNSTIERIVEETVLIEGDPYAYYVGYDQHANRLFEFKKGTVNVTYEVFIKPEPPIV